MLHTSVAAALAHHTSASRISEELCHEILNDGSAEEETNEAADAADAAPDTAAEVEVEEVCILSTLIRRTLIHMLFGLTIVTHIYYNKLRISNSVDAAEYHKTPAPADGKKWGSLFQRRAYTPYSLYQTTFISYRMPGPWTLHGP